MHPIYLDNASTSFPKPACVPDAVYRYMTACGSNVSRGGYRSAYSAEELVFETRERLCALFHGGDARCVVFTPNITTSLNLLLKGAREIMCWCRPWSTTLSCVRCGSWKLRV